MCSNLSGTTFRASEKLSNAVIKPPSDTSMTKNHTKHNTNREALIDRKARYNLYRQTTHH